MSEKQTREFFEHSGVLGMKWGVRKSIDVSERPWSSYSSKDYTREQWHAACLIHNDPSPSAPKSSSKLPIKTPNGVVNRHGVFAAAAVLAGARGGVQASQAQKDAAARKLRKIYEEMGAKPPPSLLNHSSIINFLESVGIPETRYFEIE